MAQHWLPIETLEPPVCFRLEEAQMKFGIKVKGANEHAAKTVMIQD